MRILFFGDLQLEAGRELGNGAEYGDGSRFHDQTQVLQQLVRIADDEMVDVVVNLGDTFERPKPSPHAVLAYQAFQRILRPVPHIVLLGNHDVRSAALHSIVNVYDGERTTVVTRPQVVNVGEVAFACLPWAPTSTIVAALDGGSRHDVKRLAVDALVKTAQEMRVREQHPDTTAWILLGHWAVSGSSLPSGSSVEDLLDEPVIPWQDMDVLGYRLAAFGHIHQPQVIARGSADTPIFYAGSAAVCNWGETGSPHGCWIFDTEANELRFVEIPDRQFVNVYANDADDIDVDGAVVRFAYLESEGVDENEVRAALVAAGARKVFFKRHAGETVNRARVESAQAEVTPRDAIRLWLESRDVPAETQAAMREQHARYVEVLDAA